jgi:hypothetical protein
MGDDMSLITAAALASGLFFPSDAGPPPQRPVILALNPQPEPPGKAKVKRIYTGGPDSRRDKVIKSKQPMKQTPAAKY